MTVNELRVHGAVNTRMEFLDPIFHPLVADKNNQNSTVGGVVDSLRVISNKLDGLEAVNKMNAGSKYDLVLMDIIMPNLDGVSACHLIRQFDNTPIIAMTSNIRSDDISMYFQHGT